MSETIIIYQNDKLFARDFLLRKPDNTNYDLTGHTAIFEMTSVYGGTPKIDAAATIVAPATDGRVRYTFTAADTDTVDRYHADIEVTETATGKVLTFRIATVEVRPTL